MSRSIDILNILNDVKTSPSKAQEKVLERLLYKAANTKFGKHYHFADILNGYDIVSDFKQCVPIHTYDDMFNQWWHRSLNGESDVAWMGDVKYFALSSGTSSSSSKYIPVTGDMRRSMKRAALNILRATKSYEITEELLTKNWLTIGGSATLKKHNHSLVGDLSGINSLNPPFWVKNYKKPTLQIAKLENWEDRTKAIVENAPNWDISVLIGIPSWVQLTLEHIIETHNLQSIHDIWPNLSLFVTGGINFEPYKASFEALLDKPIEYLDTYLASEGFFAYQDQPNSTSMKLILNRGIYYEFIPFDSEHFDDEGVLKPNVATLDIKDIEEGIDYAIIISTCAGAWRYMIGDTIRFTNKAESLIQISGRTSQFLSVCGEHVSQDNLNQTIIDINHECHSSFHEFIVGPVPKNGHYFHEWYIGSDTPHDEDYIADLIDRSLKTLNDDYRAERNAMLDKPVVHIIKPEIFYEWIAKRGKLNGQSKIPRVLKGDRFVDWQMFVQNSGRS